MTTRDQQPVTPEKIILGVLVYEFRAAKHEESHAKIRHRLRNKNFDTYDQELVDRLRLLKNFLQQEIGKHQRSRYHKGSHGQYAALEDFRVDQLVDDCCSQFSSIAKEEIDWFVPFAVYVYYLR